MTITAAAATPARAPRDARVTFPRVVRSEWLRFRSLRSSWITLTVTVVIVIGFAALACALRAAHWPPHDAAEALTFDPVKQSIGPAAIFGELATGVLGVLLVTGEYATGMVRSTFTAVPRRLAVLAARLLVFAAILLVVLVPSMFAAFEVGQHFLAPKAIDIALSAPGVGRAVLGGGLYLVAVGVLGMGLGWALRHTAGAIATLFGLLFMLSLIVRFLPDPWPSRISTWLPLEAGSAVWTVHPGGHSLAPWAGFGVLMGYAAAALVVGAVLLRTRDV